MAMSKHEAARRYLQASMASGISDEQAADAHRGTMAQLERAYPDIRRHAIAGARQDFDLPLTRLESAHQRELRGSEGMTEHDVRRHRSELRDEPARPRARAPKRGAVRAGVRGGRGYARARRTILSSSGGGDVGSVLLQAIGVGIGLSLLYLTLSPNGSKAFATLLNGVSKFLRGFVGPLDPLNPTPARHAGAEQVGPANAAPAGAVSASPVQRSKLNPRFGPAPGIGTPITPTGVLP